MANVTSVKVDGVTYPCEDTYAREQAALKINTSDIANNLTTSAAGKVLDASKGKELNDNKLAKSAISISGTALVITTT